MYGLEIGVGALGLSSDDNSGYGFSYGLFGPVLNGVGILVLQPSCGSEFCCLIIY